MSQFSQVSETHSAIQAGQELPAIWSCGRGTIPQQRIISPPFYQLNYRKIFNSHLLSFSLFIRANTNDKATYQLSFFKNLIAGGSLMGESILSRSMALMTRFELVKPFGLTL